MPFNYRRSKMFQTIKSVKSNNLCLKYQSFTSSDCKDKGVRQYEFVADPQWTIPSKDK